MEREVLELRAAADGAGYKVAGLLDALRSAEEPLAKESPRRKPETGAQTEDITEPEEPTAAPLAELKSEANGTKAELKSEVTGAKAELKSEVTGAKAELKGEAKGTEAELEETTPA